MTLSRNQERTPKSNANKPATTSNPAAVPTHAPYVPGAFVWFELRTPDAAAAQRFYADVVGWTTHTMDMGGEPLTLLNAGTEAVAHVQPVKKGAAAFVSYVAAEDVDASARAVERAGGKVLGKAFDLPNVGRMVEVQDPQGAALFLFRSAQGQSGQPVGPGGFIWSELWASDDRKALAFVTSVFGYAITDMPMGDITYRVLRRGTDNLAGVTPSMDHSAGDAWVPYIHVTDVNAARARALKLGAKPVGETRDVAGVGRMAVLVDPQGARFAVMTPSRRA